MAPEPCQTGHSDQLCYALDLFESRRDLGPGPKLVCAADGHLVSFTQISKYFDQVSSSDARLDIYPFGLILTDTNVRIASLRGFSQLFRALRSNNFGTIRAQQQGKPCTELQQKAKRTNKIAN
jgi:hypothetical protein